LNRAKRIWSAALLAVLVISSVTAAGCDAGGMTVPGVPTSASSPSQYAQVLSNSLLVMKNALTYKFNIDTSVSMDVKGGVSAGKLNVGSKLNGVIKNNTNEAQLNMEVSLTSNQEETQSGTQNATLQMYMVADTIYLGMDIPSIGHQWFKAPFSEELANIYSLNEVQQQIAPLAANITNLKLVKSEVFDGSDCYVLSMTPNMAEIMPWLSQDLPGDINTDQLAKIFKQLSYTVWIAKDSGQLINLQGTMQLQISANQFSKDQSLDLNSLTMNITLAMKLYDYNVPVTITLPPDAKNASALPNS
jgi:hypothetical protein